MIHQRELAIAHMGHVRQNWGPSRASQQTNPGIKKTTCATAMQADVKQRVHGDELSAHVQNVVHGCPYYIVCGRDAGIF
jgi:hypothetical protein